MKEQEVVKFNVGGRKYDVSFSLLLKYPDSRLARKASRELRHRDGHHREEIYIERDGERFAYCLDFLRDKKCNLPLTMSRDSLLDDLDYYGIEVRHPESIKYTIVDLDPTIAEESNISYGMIKDLNNQIESKRKDCKIQILTLLLLKEYMAGMAGKEKNGKFNFELTKEKKHQVDEMLVRQGEKIDVSGIVSSLATYGLSVEKSSSSRRCLVVSRSKDPRTSRRVSYKTV